MTLSVLIFACSIFPLGIVLVVIKLEFNMQELILPLKSHLCVPCLCGSTQHFDGTEIFTSPLTSSLMSCSLAVCYPLTRSSKESFQKKRQNQSHSYSTTENKSQFCLPLHFFSSFYSVLLALPPTQPVADCCAVLLIKPYFLPQAHQAQFVLLWSQSSLLQRQVVQQ